MGRYCSVPQCRKYAFEEGVSFHHYPRDKKLTKRWVSKLKMGKKLTAHAMVCSRHFSADAFKVKRAGAKGMCSKTKLAMTPVLNHIAFCHSLEEQVSEAIIRSVGEPSKRLTRSCGEDPEAA